ncbi:MAG: tyrosine-protein phosphatase [Chloroflexi bacterium]|nr:tyrosine-protein phosphatase [Chloroflexota bacterium]
MPYWIREGLLAISPRPGYRPGPEFIVPREEVDAWVQQTRDFGVASIICLISDDQLPLYAKALPGGLLLHYRESGFAVAHVPTFDGMTTPYTPEQYEEAWEAFLRLPKPVLVHCSAGFDRTGRIVDHILSRLSD